MHTPLSPRSRAYLIPFHRPALLVRALTTREENLGIHANDWLRAAVVGKRVRADATRLIG